MNDAISGLYLTIHVVGLILVLWTYRGTRAFFPGVATFLMLACAYVVSLVSPRDLGLTIRWPGAAWLDLLTIGTLIGALGDFCLLGLIFALAAPLSGGKRRVELWLAVATAAVGFLAYNVVMIFDQWAAMGYVVPLAAVCYFLIALAMWRRFQTTPLGIASAFAFLGEGIATATGFLFSLLTEQPSSLFILVLRTVGLVSWSIFLVFLATARTNPRVCAGQHLEPPRSTFSSQHAEMRWAILLVLGLFFWAVYEILTGGPVASYITWAKIPLPLVLLFVCWSGTVGWLLFVFDHAALGAPEETETTSETAIPQAAQGDLLRWYQLRRGPAVVFFGVGLLLLVLNLVPRTMDDLGEVYPGAAVKPAVRRFGFPQSAIYSVSTVQTDQGHDAFGFPNNSPSKVTIEFVRPGPKLKWLASTQAVTFEDGSTSYVSYIDLLVDIAVFVVLIVVTLALCKWWSNKMMRSLNMKVTPTS